MKWSKDMGRRKRRNHSATVKAQVTLGALKGDKTLTELARQFDVHPNQIMDLERYLPVAMQSRIWLLGDTVT